MKSQTPGFGGNKVAKTMTIEMGKVSGDNQTWRLAI